MCNCITETEDKLFAHIKEKYPERTLVHDSEEGLQNTAFTFGTEEDPGGTKLFIPFQYRYTFEKKNGATSAIKKESVNMFFTFCPFCGVPYKPKTEA